MSKSVITDALYIGRVYLNDQAWDSDGKIFCSLGVLNLETAEVEWADEGCSASDAMDWELYGDGEAVMVQRTRFDPCGSAYCIVPHWCTMGTWDTNDYDNIGTCEYHPAGEYGWRDMPSSESLRTYIPDPVPGGSINWRRGGAMSLFIAGDPGWEGRPAECSPGLAAATAPVSRSAPVKSELVAVRDSLCVGCKERVGVCRCALVQSGCQNALLSAVECPIGIWKA